MSILAVKVNYSDIGFDQKSLTLHFFIRVNMVNIYMLSLTFTFPQLELALATKFRSSTEKNYILHEQVILYDGVISSSPLKMNRMPKRDKNHWMTKSS